MQDELMIIPKHTKAAILYSVGKPLKITDQILLPKLRDGQVLVKIHYAGLCHSQLKEIDGERGEDKYLPHMLGHEGTGKVLKIGKKVTKVKVGEEVILTWIKGKGLNEGGSVYQSSDGTIINAGSITTFSHHSVVSENRLIKRPTSIEKKTGVLFGCAIPTGGGIVLNETSIDKKSLVGIIGFGGIGLSAFLAAKCLHPQQIIVIDVEDKKLKIADQLGATETINAQKINVLKKINSLTNNKGLDVVIEAAGLTKTIELGFEIIKKNGGHLIFASHPKYGDKISIDPFDLISGKKISGSWGGKCLPDQDIPKLNNLFLKNNISLDFFTNTVYKLENINEAVKDLKNRKILRAIIKMD